MAATAAGAQLTEAHRLAQLDINRRALQAMLAVWPMLDTAALNASFPAYSDTARTVLAAFKAESATTAAAYLRAFREAEGVPGQADVSLMNALDRQQALTSLLVTGPVAVKSAIRGGHTVDRAADLALSQTLGATTRLVLQGGRDTIEHTARRDEQAVGWARVTDGDPCYFCAMLAGRGAVYLSQDSGGFEPHDRCGCEPEPIYNGQDHKLPGRAGEFSKLWRDSTAGLSGKDARNAFRRAYEAQRRGVTG